MYMHMYMYMYISIYIYIYICREIHMYICADLHLLSYSHVQYSLGQGIGQGRGDVKDCVIQGLEHFPHMKQSYEIVFIVLRTLETFFIPQSGKAKHCIAPRVRAHSHQFAGGGFSRCRVKTCCHGLGWLGRRSPPASRERNHRNWS